MLQVHLVFHRNILTIQIRLYAVFVHFKSNLFETDKKLNINSYNHGHNLLKFFDTLPNFLFTTRETKRDY